MLQVITTTNGEIDWVYTFKNWEKMKDKEQENSIMFLDEVLANTSKCSCDGSCKKSEKEIFDTLTMGQINKEKNESTIKIIKDIFNFEDIGVKETENKVDYSEIDWIFITQLAERMNSNKDKYPPNNWKKPINIEFLKQSLLRHVLAVMLGHYEDDERMFGHLESIALNAQFINYQLKNNK